MKYTITFMGGGRLIRRVLDWWSDLLDSLYSLLQRFANHYLTLFMFFVWTLSTPDNNCHYSRLLLITWNSALYSFGVDPRKTPSSVVAYCCRRYLATGCVPRICLRGKVSTYLLPSNKSIRQNTSFDIHLTVIPFGFSKWPCFKKYPIKICVSSLLLSHLPLWYPNVNSNDRREEE
jgi:hypothetical protein